MQRDACARTSLSGRVDDELAPVVDALVDRALVLLDARQLQKALRITHALQLPVAQSLQDSPPLVRHRP